MCCVGVTVHRAVFRRTRGVVSDVSNKCAVYAIGAPCPSPFLQGENYGNSSYPPAGSSKGATKSDETEHLYTNLEFVAREQVCVCVRACGEVNSSYRAVYSSVECSLSSMIKWSLSVA